MSDAPAYAATEAMARCFGSRDDRTIADLLARVARLEEQLRAVNEKIVETRLAGYEVGNTKATGA